ATGRRADTVDRLALGFIALAALYLLVGSAIVPSAPSSLSVRLLAFRQDAGFVLVLLGARHAPLPADFLQRAGRAAIAVAAVVGAVCIFETLDASGWNHFVVSTIRYTRYEVGILHAKIPNYDDIRIYGTIGGGQIVRAGSVFVSALTCGFYLVLGFALALERTVRERTSPAILLALPVIGAGLLLTQTRSAILAGVIVTILAFAPAAGRRRSWRTQLGLLMAILAIVAIPAVVSTGLTKRVTGALNNTDSSSLAHASAFWDGLHAIARQPLGYGLGTSAGTGQRFQTAGSSVVVPENDYLQVGVELGVIGTLLFVALTVAVVVHLRRAARRWASGPLAATMAAAAGLMVAAWVLQTWTDVTVSWTMWGMAGASLGVARTQLAGAPAGLAGPRRAAHRGEVTTQPLTA
ncbi:MAG: O-Antigen ligase, partial [Solirubrobacteraceae bacterium]|nr:O-Antigen ligase [Solirubrobacteraceae bacterium]